MTKPAPDADGQLLLEYARGREAALEELFHKYRRMIVGLAYRFLQNRAEAEDAAQEVFLKICDSAPRYRPTAKLSTWIYRITVNLCLNRQRAGRARPSISLEETSLSSAASGNGFPGAGFRGGDPASDFERKMLAEEIARAVDALPPHQKTVLILKKYEGLSYAEIADIMDCSAGAVDSLLQRAKQNLRAGLKDLRSGGGAKDSEIRSV